MNLKPFRMEPQTDPLAAETPTVALRGHSYEDHRHIVPTLLESMASCGCWLLEQRALSPTTTALSMEVQLRSIFELYSGILASGVELTRDSHTRMTGLCTVRDHNPRQAKRRRILNVRLEISFLELTETDFSRSAVGLA